MYRLYEHMDRLLAATDTAFLRYLYSRIEWNDRMVGLVGPRGVGKTTLFLQHIKLMGAGERALYVSADHMYFSDHTLYETAESLFKNGGAWFFIDEVHKYPGWSRELKAMYDAFPGLHVYFTGSSILDLEKGEADLSRRAPVYMMQGLSFREFLCLRHGLDVSAFTLEQILDQEATIPNLEHPLPLFREYLRNGYYPFGVDPAFDIELEQVVSRTLEYDIPQFAAMNTATGFKLKRLMMIVAGSAPFKPNLSKLASQVQVSRNNVEDYLRYMEKAGMVAQLRVRPEGLGALGKLEKVYLDNPNLIYNLGQDEPDIGTVRETFFFNQMRVDNAVWASPVSDFCIGDATFEVGGKNKGGDQLKGIDHGYIVRDDIETGARNVIPLWAFGLTY